MAKTKKKRTRRARTSSRRRITPEDLNQFHFVSDPQISPDGKTIVCAKKHIGEKNEYVTNLWFIDTSGRKGPQQFTSAGRDGHARWSPDGKSIAFISSREKHNPQIFTIPASGGEATKLSAFPEGTIAAFKWSPDGRSIAVKFRQQEPDWTEAKKKEREEKGLTDPPRVLDHWWYRLDGDGYFNAQRFHLYLVDVETGKHKKIFDKDTMGFFTFDFSPDGKKLVISTNRDRRASLKPWNDDLLILDVKTSKFKQITNLPSGVKDSPAWSPGGKFIAYAGRVGPDGTYSTKNLELWVCDPKTGNARSLTDREDYCLMAPPFTDTAEISFSPNFCWSPDSKRIFMTLGRHGSSHIASVSARGGKIQFHTRGSVVHNMGNISKETKQIAMTIGVPAELDEIHVGKIAPTIRTRALSNFNGDYLKNVQVSKPQSEWIRSADGNKVQVWTIKPPGFKRGKKYPAVLEIHGGPHAQYGWGYFHEFQVLAAQGYVVFYSNPRGSKGYGEDFCHAIHGQWGGADWTDMQAVIKHMQKQRFVNPKRMGVMGGSYGGYMTNWIIGHTNEFKAAITDRCVSDIKDLLGTSDFMEGLNIYWKGNLWDDTESIWDQSPLKYFGNVKTPTLIIHSEGDLRCNIAQSELVHTALTMRKIPNRFVRYPRTTSHGMSRCGPPDMRLHRLHQILKWWKEYL